MLPCCFPKYTPEDIAEMQYQLLTYRYLQPNDRQLSSSFLYMFSRLTKDIREKKLDPFLIKVMGQPNT